MKRFEGFRFFYSDYKIGVSLDKDDKRLCILTKDNVIIYDDVDSFVDDIRSFITNFLNIGKCASTKE